MNVELYSEVALGRDVPEEGLREGDVATVVERLERSSGEVGYVLEVFSALGQTRKVVVLPASALKALSNDDVWAVRSTA